MRQQVLRIVCIVVLIAGAACGLNALGGQYASPTM